MATKVKPSRLNVTGTPQAGQVPVYVDEDSFQWGAGGGGGTGDVVGPASSTDGDIVLFDGTTGKLIKDGNKSLSDLQDKLTAGDYIDISESSGGTKTVTGSNTITTTLAKTLTSVTLDGKCEQSGTPTPSSPVNIVCNNGTLKVDNQGNVYADGTAEIVSDGTNTATAEMLLSVGTYKDTQEILTGAVNRQVGIKVLDGTEDWNESGTLGNDNHRFSILFDASENAGGSKCTHINKIIQNSTTTQVYRPCIRFSVAGTSCIFYDTSNTTTLEQFTTWLAGQYANGTPVILVYPLATSATESVEGQTLDISDTYTLTAETTNPSGTIVYTEQDGTIISSTLESKTAASGGTDVSLVTTGEKYTWNNKQNTLTAGDGIDITSNVISNTGVLSSNNTYDNIIHLSQADYDSLVTKDPNTFYSTPDDGEDIRDDLNTKTFYLTGNTGQTNIDTAQDAYDWYSVGKNPIISYNNYSYVLATATSTKLTFRGGLAQQNQNSSSFIAQDIIELNIVSDLVDSITLDISVVGGSYLRLGQNYTTPYTPTNDGDPTSKKYVDEHGPNIPVYYYSGDFNSNITFNMIEAGEYRLYVRAYHGTTVDKTLTLTVDGTTIGTITSNLIENLNASINFTASAGSTAVLSVSSKTNFTIQEVYIEKVNVQSGYLTATVN